MSSSRKIIVNVRLVNWHKFEDDTIQIVDPDQMFDSKGNYILKEMPITILHAKSGVGKSIIMDAIQYVLTNDCTHFNMASKGHVGIKKRTLASYVRGATEIASCPYLRKDFVTSYVALEIYEEAKKGWFVIGAQITIGKNQDRPREKWFCQNGRLKDFSFTVKKNGMVLPAVDDEFRCKGKKIEFYLTDEEANQVFRRRLGELRSDFSRSIWNGLAFNGEQNLQTFVKKSVLKEENVNIENLRYSIDKIMEFKATLEDVKKKVKQLDTIISLGLS